jgi:hypothetical protein
MCGGPSIVFFYDAVAGEGLVGQNATDGTVKKSGFLRVLGELRGYRMLDSHR